MGRNPVQWLGPRQLAALSALAVDSSLTVAGLVFSLAARVAAPLVTLYGVPASLPSVLVCCFASAFMGGRHYSTFTQRTTYESTPAARPRHRPTPLTYEQAGVNYDQVGRSELLLATKRQRPAGQLAGAWRKAGSRRRACESAYVVDAGPVYLARSWVCGTKITASPTPCTADGKASGAIAGHHRHGG